MEKAVLIDFLENEFKRVAKLKPPMFYEFTDHAKLSFLKATGELKADQQAKFLELEIQSIEAKFENDCYRFEGDEPYLNNRTGEFTLNSRIHSAYDSPHFEKLRFGRSLDGYLRLNGVPIVHKLFYSLIEVDELIMYSSITKIEFDVLIMPGAKDGKLWNHAVYSAIRRDLDYLNWLKKRRENLPKVEAKKSSVTQLSTEKRHKQVFDLFKRYEAEKGFDYALARVHRETGVSEKTIDRILKKDVNS